MYVVAWLKSEENKSTCGTECGEDTGLDSFENEMCQQDVRSLENGLSSRLPQLREIQKLNSESLRRKKSGDTRCS